MLAYPLITSYTPVERGIKKSVEKDSMQNQLTKSIMINIQWKQKKIVQMHHALSLIKIRSMENVLENKQMDT